MFVGQKSVNSLWNGVLRFALVAFTILPARAGDDPARPRKSPPVAGILAITTANLGPPYTLRILNPKTSEWQTLLRSGPWARLSPDGTTIALGRSGFVFTRELKARSTPTVIGQIGALELPEEFSPHVAWCPDNKTIVATGITQFTPEMKFETKCFGPGAGRRLSVPASDVILDVSTDGQWLLTARQREGSSEIFRMRFDGSEQSRLTPGANGLARFSPNGTKILFTRTDKDRERTGLYVIDSDGKDPHLVHPFDVEAGCWSPDGERIAVVKDDRRISPVPEPLKRVAAPVEPVPHRPTKNNVRIEILDLQGKLISSHPTPGDQAIRSLDWR
jgi:WD40-like Beta Propeller Repeat